MYIALFHHLLLVLVEKIIVFGHDEKGF